MTWDNQGALNKGEISPWNIVTDHVVMGFVKGQIMSECTSIFQKTTEKIWEISAMGVFID